MQAVLTTFFPTTQMKLHRQKAISVINGAPIGFMFIFFVTPKGKISKSKNIGESSNKILTVDVLIENGYHPMEYRYFCLNSHYRKSLLFSWENLENAAIAYRKLIAKINRLEDVGTINTIAVEEYKRKFQDALNDDLNTSLSLTIIHEVLKSDINDVTKLALIRDFDVVLSLDLIQNKKDEVIISDEIQELLDKRVIARKNKDFAESDRIRNELNEKGIIVVDTKNGQEWHFK